MGPGQKATGHNATGQKATDKSPLTYMKTKGHRQKPPDIHGDKRSTNTRPPR